MFIEGSIVMILVLGIVILRDSARSEQPLCRTTYEFYYVIQHVDFRTCLCFRLFRHANLSVYESWRYLEYSENNKKREFLIGTDVDTSTTFLF